MSLKLLRDWVPYSSRAKYRTAQLRESENVFLASVASNTGLRFVTVEKTEDVLLQ
jgi:hypothetical protein